MRNFIITCDLCQDRLIVAKDERTAKNKLSKLLGFKDYNHFVFIVGKKHSRIDIEQIGD